MPDFLGKLAAAGNAIKDVAEAAVGEVEESTEAMQAKLAKYHPATVDKLWAFVEAYDEWNANRREDRAGSVTGGPRLERLNAIRAEIGE